MKKISSYIREYFSATFSWYLYGSIAILLVVLLSINYSIDLENGFINKFTGTWYRGILLALLTAGSYLITCMLIQKFTSHKNIFKQKGFWWSFVFFFVVFGVYRGSYFAITFTQNILDTSSYYFHYKCIANIEDLVFGVLPFLVFYYAYDHKNITHCYGIKGKEANLTPYIIMLIIMCLPIYLASLTEVFLQTYPKANKAYYQEFALHKGMEEWKSLLAFEFFYLFSFLAVEVMFRGYLIYRMEKYLGVYAVLPMLVAYAVIHFGKPLGETIGSIGGAYILGILALKSQNIYGGIFIHIGVALLMEVFAFINS